MKSSLIAIPSPAWRERMEVMVVVEEKETGVAAPVLSLAEDDCPYTTGSPPAPWSARIETFSVKFSSSLISFRVSASSLVKLLI